MVRILSDCLTDGTQGRREEAGLRAVDFDEINRRTTVRLGGVYDGLVLVDLSCAHSFARCAHLWVALGVMGRHRPQCQNGVSMESEEMVQLSCDGAL